MSDILDAVAALLRTSEQGRPDGQWEEAAGRQLAALIESEGWLKVGLPEALGGAGGELRDLLEVVEAVVTPGWPTPVSDFLLATAVQRALGIALDGAVGSAIVVREAGIGGSRGGVTVSAPRVPWANWSTHLLIVSEASPDTRVSYVPTARLPGPTGRGLNGAPVTDVELIDAVADYAVVIHRPLREVQELILCGGALVRSVQTVAAIRRAEVLTIDYSRARRQFGRELVKFQAVQQQLALLAAESAAAQAAVARAIDGTKMLDDLRGDPRLASAKVRSVLAGSEVARISHQVHGAIGTTKEYELHRHTTAIWQWRDEFGNEFFWSEELARAVAPGTDVWAWITAGEDS